MFTSKGIFKVHTWGCLLLLLKNLQRLLPRLASLGLGDVQYIYEAETEYNE